MDQVAKDKRLLDVAQDCFQFVTKFFEVINVSAVHIYHSALELCPVSSVVRELYYHRRITLSPEVVIGTPDSWDPTIGISGKDDYIGLPIWSPCGRFIAAQTRKAVEIRNQLTLELITILQPTETIPLLTGPLAYSPDGRSIACASDIAIIIWDIQTGGVAKEIKCGADNVSLVWSLDGGTICTIYSEDREAFTVHTYNVSSGTMSSPGTLRSGDSPHLWTVDKSFRVMTTERSGYHIGTIDIFEVGSTLARIQSFSPPLLNASTISFSPTVHHISISGDNTLCIFNIQNSENLLIATGYFLSHYFSSDGCLFAASKESAIHVWKRVSNSYAVSGTFQCQGLSNPSLQLSLTPSSILGHSGDILRMWRVHRLPVSFETQLQHYVGLSRSGTRVATARELEDTVTIIDLLTQAPPQFIDTDIPIEGLVITGKVLLVAGLGKLVAWLLTEEGLVDGVIGDRRVGISDAIWTIPLSLLVFSVEGQLGVINQDGNALHVYHTETGEVLCPTRTPQKYYGNHWYYPNDPLRGRHYLCYHNLCNTPPEDSWQISQPALREGWVKDSKGKHRFWVPVEWRTDWDPADWRHDVTIQFSYFEGRPVLIKF